MKMSIALTLLLGANLSPDAFSPDGEHEIVVDEAASIIAYVDDDPVSDAEDDVDAGLGPSLPLADDDADAEAAKKPPGPKPKGCSVDDGRGGASTLALLGLLVVVGRRRGRA